jgi:hypothetical protein
LGKYRAPTNSGACTLDGVEVSCAAGRLTARRNVHAAYTGPGQRKEQAMLDVILLGLGLGFFVLAIAYAYGCERL